MLWELLSNIDLWKFTVFENLKASHLRPRHLHQRKVVLQHLLKVMLRFKNLLQFLIFESLATMESRLFFNQQKLLWWVFLVVWKSTTQKLFFWKRDVARPPNKILPPDSWCFFWGWYFPNKTRNPLEADALPANAIFRVVVVAVVPAEVSKIFGMGPRFS